MERLSCLLNHISDSSGQVIITSSNNNNEEDLFLLNPTSTSNNEFSFIEVETLSDKNVGIIYLNRPKALNALNTDLVNEVRSTLLNFNQNPDIKCIIITSKIKKAFAAGADIKSMSKQTMMDISKPGNFVTTLGYLFSDIQTPTIAAVRGYALGGGCELAMQCDIIIASDKAKFGQPEIKIGTIPGAGGTQRLVRAIGKSKAMELVLTGRTLNAIDAERAGLVSHVVPDEEVINTAVQLASEIASLSAPVVHRAKDCVNKSYEMSLNEGVNYEQRIFHSTFALEDKFEGMDAFINKRKPNWKDK